MAANTTTTSSTWLEELGPGEIGLIIMLSFGFIFIRIWAEQMKIQQLQAMQSARGVQMQDMRGLAPQQQLQSISTPYHDIEANQQLSINENTVPMLGDYGSKPSFNTVLIKDN